MAPAGTGLPDGPAGANLPAVRGHNEALVLDLLRRATAVSGGDGISRVELAGRTGLTPQAVSKIVGRLRDEGMVDEAGRGASTGGKPRTMLRLVPRARLAVGVHMDRDELTVVLADLMGEAVVSETVPFDFGGDREAALETVDTAVRRVRSTGAGGGPVLGVGVACPGPLDHRAGVLRRIPHLAGWEGFPLRDVLAERLGLPVVLDKDTNAAVLTVLGRGPRAGGAYRGGTAGPGGAGQAGAGRGGSGQAGGGRDVSGWSGGGSWAGGGGGWGPDGNHAYLHLGTGLGAGLVLGGGLYRGTRTGAGEFGHQTVQLDGPLCECGNRGCLEAMCLTALERGDTAGAARLLGVGAANLLRLLDIDLVVLGGREVLAAPGLYLREVTSVLAERVPDPSWQPVPVEVAEGGARAVADGAAQLVLAPLFRGGRPVWRHGPDG